MTASHSCKKPSRNPIDNAKKYTRKTKINNELTHRKRKTRPGSPLKSRSKNERDDKWERRRENEVGEQGRQFYRRRSRRSTNPSVLSEERTAFSTRLRSAVHADKGEISRIFKQKSRSGPLVRRVQKGPKSDPRAKRGFWLVLETSRPGDG